MTIDKKDPVKIPEKGGFDFKVPGKEGWPLRNLPPFSVLDKSGSINEPIYSRISNFILRKPKLSLFLIPIFLRSLAKSGFLKRKWSGGKLVIGWRLNVKKRRLFGMPLRMLYKKLLIQS